MKIENNTDYNNICKKEKAIQQMVDELEKSGRLLGYDDRFHSFVMIAEKMLDRIYEAKLAYDKERIK